MRVHSLLATVTTVALGVGLALAPATPASATVAFTDNFNRADDAALGSAWIETEYTNDPPDLAIVGNHVTNPSNTYGYARAVAVQAAKVEADVTAGPSNGYAALILAATTDPSNNIFVKVQRNNGSGAGPFDTLFVYRGNNGIGGSTALGTPPSVELTPFSAGHMTVSRMGLDLHITIDTGGDSTPEVDLHRTLPNLAFGSGVGLGAYGTASIDNFVASNLPQTIEFTSAPDSPAEVGGTAVLTASASSGEAVTFASTTPTICSVTGATVSYLAPGTCRVTAAQAGTGGYDPASAAQLITVGKIQPTITALVSAATPIYGEGAEVEAELAFTGDYQPGSVQFTVDGSPTGPPVPVGPLQPTAGQLIAPHAGFHTLVATYTPTNAAIAATATDTLYFNVSPAASTTQVSIVGGVATATVAPSPPATATPTGNVTFEVNGLIQGNTPLVGGQAVLSSALSPGDTVSASYRGSTDYLPSADSTSQSEPTIVATVAGRQTAGWYSDTATVSFACTPHGSALAEPCPAPVLVSADGAGQVVTRAVHAVDGGIATASAVVNVDRTAPEVRITGLDASTPYLGDPGRLADCDAADHLSGVTSCTVSSAAAGTGKVKISATAADVAGNVATATATVASAPVVVAGASYRKGRWILGRGEPVTLLAVSAKRPVLLAFAGGRPLRFHPAGTVDGQKRWSLGLVVPSAAKPGPGKLKVRIGASYTLPIAVRG